MSGFPVKDERRRVLEIAAEEQIALRTISWTLKVVTRLHGERKATCLGATGVFGPQTIHRETSVEERKTIGLLEKRCQFVGETAADKSLQLAKLISIQACIYPVEPCLGRDMGHAPVELGAPFSFLIAEASCFVDTSQDIF